MYVLFRDRGTQRSSGIKQRVMRSHYQSSRPLESPLYSVPSCRECNANSSDIQNKLDKTEYKMTRSLDFDVDEEFAFKIMQLYSI